LGGSQPGCRGEGTTEIRQTDRNEVCAEQGGTVKGGEGWVKATDWSRGKPASKRKMKRVRKPALAVSCVA